MLNIEIKDLDILNEKERKLKEAQEALKKTKEMNQVKKQEKELQEIKKRIRTYSTYKSKQIGKIIAKLMSQFEGVDYKCSKTSLDFSWNSDYRIDPVSSKSPLYCHPGFKIRNIEENKPSYYKENKDEPAYCFITPSNLKSGPSIKFCTGNDDINYVQIFLDYLYVKREQNNLIELSDEDLEEILQSFLKESVELQQERKIQIEEIIKEKEKIKREKDFKASCMIDRNLIYNALIYIINNYDKGLYARQEKIKDWDYYNEASVLTGYHILTITYNNNDIQFKDIIDSDEVYPDEEYAAQININKKGKICFFELKKTFSRILNYSVYAYNFMKIISDLFYEKGEVNSDDIEQALIDISNEYKKNRKIKLKN